MDSNPTHNTALDDPGSKSTTQPSASAPAAVELREVSKTYASMTAVDYVSLSVRDGEFFTFVGPSGCGKTTTLRLIGGFESPASGDIRIDGSDVADVPPEDRGVGVVFQSYALFPHMTVGENVAYGLKFTEPPGGGTNKARVSDLLDLVDLGGMAARDPETLSGGQQQRVAMARALAPGPDVLLLDEPMSALDAQLRERLRVQIRTIQRELGITTIYVTHDQEEALAISDRVAVMRDGRIEQIGTPREIYHRPASRFVAEFVGDNNVFEGRVVDIRSASDHRVADLTVGEATLTVELPENVEPPKNIEQPNKTAAITEAVTVGDKLTFCVRPEQLRVGGQTNQLRTTVESSEFLGETTRIHLDWQGHEILARTPTDLAGEVVVGFEPTDAHIISVGDSQ